ncbi:hypothetical protein [Thiolinea disciformis]|uniref:hypothetical protein n=1 Tax=Thiolinea disciformis TaxID=125614 RepID=UPI00036C2F8C|nr:hypothetical protein [Thiolinea disciformis]
MSHSAGAINQLSQSGKRYALQDRVLQGFANYPDSTTKEVARAIGLQHEEYCDAPKRVFDLVALGKLVAMGERVCRITQKVAETYQVAAGAKFVGGKPVPVVPVSDADAVPLSDDDRDAVMHRYLSSL